MQHRQIHRTIWIKELNGYGIQEGPNGEELQDMEYYALRSFLVKAQMQRDLETKASVWF